MRAPEHAVVALDAAFCAWCIPGLFSLAVIQGTPDKFRNAARIGNAAFKSCSTILCRASLATFFRKAHRLETALRYMEKRPLGLGKRRPSRRIQGVASQELLLRGFVEGSSEQKAIATIQRSCAGLVALIESKCLPAYRPFCKLGGTLGFGVRLVSEQSDDIPESRSLLILDDLKRLPRPFHEIAADFSVSIRKDFAIDDLWRIWSDLRRAIGHRIGQTVPEPTADEESADLIDAGVQTASAGTLSRERKPDGVGWENHRKWLEIVEKKEIGQQFRASALGTAGDRSVRHLWLATLVKWGFLQHNGRTRNGRLYWRVGTVID